MNLIQSIARRISWHRRLLACLLVVLGVLSLAAYLRAPTEDLVTVVAARQDVAAGEVLAADQVETVAIARDQVPAGTFTTEDEAVGHTLAVSLTKGTLVQPSFLITDSAPEAGRSLVPINVPDSDLAALLTPGTAITLVVNDVEGTTVITNDAVVRALPKVPQSGGISPSAGRAPVVMVEVPTKIAASVASLGQSSGLSVILGRVD